MAGTKTFIQMMQEMNTWAKSPADTAFIGLHKIEKTADRNGNGDDVFKGTTKKDNSRPPDAAARKGFQQMQKDLKIAAGGKDVDGDNDGDVTKPKGVSVTESFNHREAATHGIMHPDMAKYKKVGEHGDFYHPSNGDKEYGKTTHNDGKTVRIQQGGKVHRFKVATTYPGLEESIQLANAELELAEQALDEKIAEELSDWFDSITEGKSMADMHARYNELRKEKGLEPAPYPHGTSKMAMQIMINKLQYPSKIEGIKKDPSKVHEEVEELQEGFANYQKGDHVHGYVKHETRRHGPIDPDTVHHGVVASHTDRHATVHWENGEKTTHHQYSGEITTRKANEKLGERTFKSYDGTERKLGNFRIDHNRVYKKRPGEEFGTHHRVNNDEHKQHLRDAHNSVMQDRKMQELHRTTADLLNGSHHSKFKEHHLKAIADIIHRAHNGLD